MEPHGTRFGHISVPKYCPTAAATSYKRRLPLWMWKRAATSAFNRDMANLDLEPSVWSASAVQHILRSKVEYVEALIKLLCASTLGNRPLFSFVDSGGASKTAVKVFSNQTIHQCHEYTILSQLLLDRIAAESSGRRESTQETRLITESFHAWNPMQIIIQSFDTLFSRGEAENMHWTAQERWKTMQRADLLKEFEILKEEETMMHKFNRHCYEAVYIALAGSISITEICINVLKKRRKVVKKHAAAAGAGTLESTVVLPLKYSLFYLIVDEILDLEDLFGHMCPHAPLSSGWTSEYPPISRVISIRMKTSPKGAFVDKPQVLRLEALLGEEEQQSGAGFIEGEILSGLYE